MKLFDGREDKKRMIEARDYALAGGQALHVWEPEEVWKKRAPRCFQKTDLWAHLFDADKERLEKTARRLGVKVLKVSSAGKPNQHVDLCGAPLARAIVECGNE